MTSDLAVPFVAEAWLADVGSIAPGLTIAAAAIAMIVGEWALRAGVMALVQALEALGRPYKAEALRATKTSIRSRAMVAESSTTKFGDVE